MLRGNSTYVAEFASTNTAGNTTKKASASGSTSSAATTYDAPQESASAPEAPSYEPEPQPAAEPTNIYKYCPTNINGNVLYCSNEAAWDGSFDSIGRLGWKTGYGQHSQ